MKKKITRFLMLFVAALLFTGSNAWAAQNAVTYTITSKTAVSTTGTAPTGSVATYAQTYTIKGQMTASNSTTLTLTGYDGCTIKGITLSMKSNTSKGAGYLSFTSGSTTIASIGTESSGVDFNNAAWNGAWSTSFVDVTPAVTTTTVGTGETVTVFIGATASSLYIQSYTITYESTLSYTITPAVNNADYGTATVAGSTITVTPAAGYQIKDYTVTTGTATVTRTSNSVNLWEANTYSVTTSADCTVTFNFEPRATYTATFSDNGTTSTQAPYVGDAIGTLPAGRTVAGNTFLGWTATAPVADAWTTLPTMIDANYVLTDNTTFYAVYGKGVSYSTEDYVLVNSTDEIDLNAKYVIASATSYYLMTGAVASTNFIGMTTAATHSGESLTYVSGAATYTLALSGGKYTLFDGTNYVSSTAATASNLVNVATPDEYSYWAISFNGNNAIIANSAKTTNPNLCSYETKNYFNCFSSTNSVYLYKQAANYTNLTSAPVAESTSAVTFTVGEGATFVGNGDFATVSESKIAGTYTLPAATKVGFAFDGWELGGSLITGADYTIDGTTAYDFVASFTEKLTPDFAFANSSIAINYNDAVSNALTNNSGVTPVYASSETSVATVAADGTVTVYGGGSTTISATIDESDSYKAASASYNLTVSDNRAEYTYTLTNSEIASATNNSSYSPDATVSSENGTWTGNFAINANNLQINGKSSYGIVSPTFQTPINKVVVTLTTGTTTGTDKYICIMKAETTAMAGSIVNDDCLGYAAKIESGDLTITLKEPVSSFKIMSSSGVAYITAVSASGKAMAKSVTINDYKYSSLYLDYNVIIPAGVEAYYCTVDGDNAVIHTVADVIPANTGVLLYKDTPEPVTLVETLNTTSTIITNNALVGYTTDTRVDYGTNDAYYALNYKTEGGVKVPGFFIPKTVDNAGAPTSFTAKANKAYLKVAASQSPIQSFNINRDGDATAIHAVEAAAVEDDNVYYDITGRRVAQPTRGLYIHNGKKVFIK